MKNFLIRLILRCVKRRPQIGAVKSFLVISTTGLGDTLWAIPAIAALRQRHPDARIALLVSPIGEELLRLDRNIDALFVLKAPHALSLLRHFFVLRRRHIDAVILFHVSQRLPLLLAGLLAPPHIVGTLGCNKGLDCLLTHGIERKAIHEIAQRLALVSLYGAPSIDPTLFVSLGTEDMQKAREILSGLSSLPLIALHPGAKDRFKQWPADGWITLGNRLVEALGCQILVTGSAQERPLVDAIASKIVGARGLAGALTTRPFACLIRAMDLFVSNDTGAMHLAFAVHTPTVALFAPTDSALCGAYFVPHQITIQKERTCTPCLRKKCRDPFCLLQISPEEVYDAALKLFHTTYGRKTPHLHPRP